MRTFAHDPSHLGLRCPLYLQYSIGAHGALDQSPAANGREIRQSSVFLRAAAEEKDPIRPPSPETSEPVVSPQEIIGGPVMNPQETIGGVGIERDSMGGYPTWSMSEGRWHLNFRLGGIKNGRQVYHVTREDRNPKGHYFFTLDSGEISDSFPETRQKGAAKFSALPKEVQEFVRTHIDDLLPPK